MTATADQLEILLRSLELPSIHANCQEIADKAEREGWGFFRTRAGPRRC